MKIINKEVIKNGEQDLIDSINGDLDWSTVEEIFRQQHKMNISDDIEYKQGDIVVYNDQVAYRLEFDVKVNFTVLLDREGSCLLVDASGSEQKSSENNTQYNQLDNISVFENEQNLDDNREEIISKSHDQIDGQIDYKSAESVQERIVQAVSDMADSIVENQ